MSDSDTHPPAEVGAKPSTPPPVISPPTHVQDTAAAERRPAPGRKPLFRS
jgi:hypothetical protein